MEVNYTNIVLTMILALLILLLWKHAEMSGTVNFIEEHIECRRYLLKEPSGNTSELDK